MMLLAWRLFYPGPWKVVWKAKGDVVWKAKGVLRGGVMLEVEVGCRPQCLQIVWADGAAAGGCKLRET
jgi:hypothetical protein